MSKEVYDEHYYSSVYSRYLKEDPYTLKLSEFWMYNCFTTYGFDLKGKKVLDFGCGPGHLTASINAACYDVSAFIMDKLEASGRQCFRSLNEIEEGYFDYVFSSHSLEHSVAPATELGAIKRILKPGGKLFLILPLEKVPGTPGVPPDIHQHFYAWNFQNITNLLAVQGYKVVKQDLIYGPTGLKFFKGNVALARRLGRLNRHWPSLFTIAEKGSVA